MKKKLTALALVVVLLAVAVVGGSLAYFTDIDNATNTMVIGNVEIEIVENVKNDAGEYEDYEDEEFVLYPVANDEVINGGNINYYYNKIVRTFNTSTSKDDAYIPSDYLFEDMPEYFTVSRLGKTIGESMRMMADIQNLKNSLPGIDCGACGAPTCRAFAEDVVKKLACVDDCRILGCNRSDKKE